MGKAKKKQKKVMIREPPSKEYTLLTLEEVRAKEQKYNIRLMAVNICVSMIYDAQLKNQKIGRNKRLLEKWRTYLRCEGIPKPYIPPDIRLFFVKLRFFEDEQVENNIDWQLAIDERSILSQNIFRKDLTRETLINEIRPNFGKEYNRDINFGLRILKSVSYYLECEDMVLEASTRILKEIVEQKVEIQTIISELFNRFAYRILCAEDAYMDSVDPRTAEYYYSGDNFEIHIWTLKNVPVLFQFLEQPYLKANLHKLKVKLQIPYNILEENLTVRGIHMHFDHCSEHAKSYVQEIIIPNEKLNAGIPDLYECLINEYNMQIDLQTQVRNKMIQRRVEYDDKLKSIEEDNKNKRKNEDDKKKSKKKEPKLPKEPPIITEDTWPDIWNDFLDKEQKDFEAFVAEVYNPNVLKLKPNEINLKRFFILGGTYELFFVEKPRHYYFNTFNMTWHANEGNLIIKEDIFVDRNSQSNFQFRQSSISQRYSSVSAISRIGRLTTASSRIEQSVSGTKKRDEYDPETTRYFMVTFELPLYLCLWGEPLPCHYERNAIGTVEEEVHNEAIDPGKSTASLYNANDSKGLSASQVALMMPNAANISRSTAENIDTERDPSISSQSKMIIPESKRLRISTNMFRPSVLSLLTQVREGGSRNINTFENFPLSPPLKVQQIRSLQRYCIPRILSSFKFPKELKEEEAEDMRGKPKGMGGTLLRRRSHDDEMLDHKNELFFSYDNQNRPERLFPVFPKTEHFGSFMTSITDDEVIKGVHPTSFYELISTLKIIRNLYRARYEHTVDRPHFTPKAKLPHRSLMSKSTIDPTEFKNRISKSKRNSSRLSIKSMTSVGRQKKEKSLIGLTVEDLKKRYASIPTESDLKDQEENDDLDNTSSSIAEEATPPASHKTYQYSRWTTEHILHKKFDREKRLITIWTDRLGTIGFAFKRYEQFPFRGWSLEPSQENPGKEVIFTLETQYVKVVLFITKEGYRGYATEPSKKFIRNRVMYLVIEKPTTDFTEIKRLFRENNLNIFSENDARFYIENGYFSEKHLAAELHTYCCMAIHSTQMKFAYSDWNRLAKRRDIVFNFAQYSEAEKNMQLVRVTPEVATFVDIKEICSDDLEIIKLEYTPTWRNIDFYADLHHLILSLYPNATESRVRDASLLCCVRNLLREIRPLSFS